MVSLGQLSEEEREGLLKPSESALGLSASYPYPRPRGPAPAALCPCVSCQGDRRPARGRSREWGDVGCVLEHGIDVLCDLRQEWNLSDHQFPYL